MCPIDVAQVPPGMEGHDDVVLLQLLARQSTQSYYSISLHLYRIAAEIPRAPSEYTRQTRENQSIATRRGRKRERLKCAAGAGPEIAREREMHAERIISRAPEKPRAPHQQQQLSNYPPDSSPKIAPFNLQTCYMAAGGIRALLL